MITQEIPISLLMEPQKNLIFRQGDFGNQIKIKFPDLTGITSAEFRLIKPDDTFVVSSGEIVENDIIITITQQMSILSGYCIFNLRLINDSSNIYTYVGRALIDENINLDQYAESQAEVNGLVFPDDFLTDEDIPDLSTYATKEYVNEAIAEIPTYTPPNYSAVPHKTGRKWIDGKDIWEVTLTLDTAISVTPTGNTLPSAVMEALDIDNILMSRAYRQRNDPGAGICDITTDIWLDSNNTWRVYSFTSWDNIKTFTIEYTKED